MKKINNLLIAVLCIICLYNSIITMHYYSFANLAISFMLCIVNRREFKNRYFIYNDFLKKFTLVWFLIWNTISITFMSFAQVNIFTSKYIFVLQYVLYIIIAFIISIIVRKNIRN